MATKRKTAKKTPAPQVEQYQMQPQKSGPSMVLVLLLIAISFFTGFFAIRKHFMLELPQIFQKG